MAPPLDSLLWWKEAGRFAIPDEQCWPLIRRMLAPVDDVVGYLAPLIAIKPPPLVLLARAVHSKLSADNFSVVATLIDLKPLFGGRREFLGLVPLVVGRVLPLVIFRSDIYRRGF